MRKEQEIKVSICLVFSVACCIAAEAEESASRLIARVLLRVLQLSLIELVVFKVGLAEQP